MTCRSAGVWGSWACRATCPSRALTMRAPVSRARAHFLLVGGCRLPVGDRALVGCLGLGGELLLGLAHPLSRGPHAGGLALQGGGAGTDFEPAELLGGQRG